MDCVATLRRILLRAALVAVPATLLLGPVSPEGFARAATPVAAVPTAAPAAPVVLVVGDSLSAGYGIKPQEGWVALLEGRLRTEGYGYRVVNASISGDTTTGGLRRLPRALASHKPAVVIIELGGNDGLRGTPIDVMRRNLVQMIELAQAAGARVILAGMQIPTNYGAAYTKAFAGVYPELAKRYGLPLVPFFLDGVALDPTLIQADGIHPTAEAQPKLLANVWPVLRPELKPARTEAPRPSATAGS
jgi:acyl-CoA thioesterase-1